MQFIPQGLFQSPPDPREAGATLHGTMTRTGPHTRSVPSQDPPLFATSVVCGCEVLYFRRRSACGPCRAERRRQAKRLRDLARSPGFGIPEAVMLRQVSIGYGKDACWEWTGGMHSHSQWANPRHRDGTGFQYVRPEVFAWRHPDYRAGCVSVRCGNRRCIRPDHLMAGHAAGGELGNGQLLELGDMSVWRPLAETPGFGVHPAYLEGRIQVPDGRDGCWLWLSGFLRDNPRCRVDKHDVFPADEFYRAAHPDHAGLEYSSRIQPGCGTRECVNPAHMLAPKPPKPPKKRPVPAPSVHVPEPVSVKPPPPPPEPEPEPEPHHAWTRPDTIPAPPMIEIPMELPYHERERLFDRVINARRLAVYLANTHPLGETALGITRWALGVNINSKWQAMYEAHVRPSLELAMRLGWVREGSDPDSGAVFSAAYLEGALS